MLGACFVAAPIRHSSPSTTSASAWTPRPPPRTPPAWSMRASTASSCAARPASSTFSRSTRGGPCSGRGAGRATGAGRGPLLEAVAGAANGPVPVTAHVGAPTTAATCALAAHAAETGAAAVMVVTPYYNRVGADEQRTYLRAVADAAGGLPVLAYTMPKMAGDHYPVELLAELAA